MCRRGVLLENGSVCYDGLISDAIGLYLKGNEFVEDGTILSKVKCLSNEIKLKSILINGKEDRIVNLVYPDRTLSVEIEGELLNDMPAAIEAKVFDSESVLLAKFAPVLFKTVVPKTTKGSFKLKETITLPDNMTNGEYRLRCLRKHHLQRTVPQAPEHWKKHSRLPQRCGRRCHSPG